MISEHFTPCSPPCSGQCWEEGREAAASTFCREESECMDEDSHMLGLAQALLLPEHVSFPLSEATCPVPAGPLSPASFLEFGAESALMVLFSDYKINTYL